MLINLTRNIKPRKINANFLITCPGSNEFVHFPQDKGTANWKNRVTIKPVMHSCMTELHDAVDIGEMNDNSFCGKWMCPAYDLSCSGELFLTFVRRESLSTLAAIWSFIADLEKYFNLNHEDEINLNITVIAFSRGVPLAVDFINRFNDEAESKSNASFTWCWRLSLLDPVLSGFIDYLFPWFLLIYIKPLEYVDKCIIQQQIGEKRAHIDLMDIKIHPAWPQAEVDKKPHMHGAFLRTFLGQEGGASIQALTVREVLFEFILPDFTLTRCPRYVIDLMLPSQSRRYKNKPMHVFGRYKPGFFKTLSIHSKRKALDQVCEVILKHLSGEYEQEFQQYINGHPQCLLWERQASRAAFDKAFYFMDRKTLQNFQICYPQTYRFLSDTSIISGLKGWCNNSVLFDELNYIKKKSSHLFKLLFENNETSSNNEKYHNLMSMVTDQSLIAKQNKEVSTTGLIRCNL